MLISLCLFLLIEHLDISFTGGSGLYEQSIPRDPSIYVKSVAWDSKAALDNDGRIIPGDKILEVWCRLSIFRFFFTEFLTHILIISCFTGNVI